ncbi:MAG: site-specific DNA-methyltransferase [Kineosporiaceae bacterium]|nr:site-specific DNA-methyltransferase [Aeromicrobium sp.]
MSAPYYRDDLVTLYHGDCLEETAWLAADVLVMDPPYGMGYESNFNRIKGTQKVGRPVAGDKTIDARDRSLIAWGDRPALVFGRWDVARPAATRHRLIWDKGNSVGMGDLSMPWGHAEEEIYVLGKGFIGKRESNVIRAQMLMSGDHARPDHPTPKPIGLMEVLISKCPAGVVADPFAGSGSTLIAARNLGRQAIGVELEERYCEIIAKRLSQQAFDFEAIA